jgi:uncharacterized membrane protein YgaE (UPF0421/DUF939 family)
MIKEVKSAFKMALAAALTYLIVGQLHLNFPFYAVIGSIIVLSETGTLTLKLGFQRAIGTVIGAFSGAFFVLALGSNLWAILFSVFFTTLLAYFIYKDGVKLGGYISAIVIISHSQFPLSYAWDRCIETFVGIAVALFVSNLIFPIQID